MTPPRPQTGRERRRLTATEVDLERLRQRALLVGAGAGAASVEEAEASLAELALLADTAGAEPVESVLQRRRTPDPATYVGKGKAKGAARARAHARRRRRHLRRRAHARRSSATSSAVRGRRRGSRRADPRHLRPARHESRRRGTGRARATALPVAAATRSRDAAQPAGWRHRHARSGRDPARGRSPALVAPYPAPRARPTRSRSDARDTTQGAPAPSPPEHRARRIHQRGQVDAAQPAHPRGRARGEPAVLHARPDHPAPAPRRRRDRPRCPTPSGSCSGCRTSWCSRSVRPWRRSSTPTCCCTSSTRVRPDAPEQIEAVRTVLREIGADQVPELLVLNKADIADPDDVKGLLIAEPGSVIVSAVTGTGVNVLLDTIATRLRTLAPIVEFIVPYERGDVVAALHREGEVLVEVHSEGGTRMRARLPGARPHSLRRLRRDSRRLTRRPVSRPSRTNGCSTPSK